MSCQEEDIIIFYCKIPIPGFSWKTCRSSITGRYSHTHSPIKCLQVTHFLEYSVPGAREAVVNNEVLALRGSCSRGKRIAVLIIYGTLTKELMQLGHRSRLGVSEGCSEGATFEQRWRWWERAHRTRIRRDEETRWGQCCVQGAQGRKVWDDEVKEKGRAGSLGLDRGVGLL